MHDPLEFAVPKQKMIHCENMTRIAILEEAIIRGEWPPITIK